MSVNQEVQVDEVDSLVDVLQRTMEVLFRLDAKLCERKLHQSQVAPHDVSAIVGITGRSKGNLVLSFPLAIARHLAASMLGEDDMESLTEQDMSDCIGEICNIVAGNLVARLECDEGGNRHISLPSVILGAHRVVWGRRDTPSDLLTFDTEIGSFAVGTSLRQGLSEMKRD